MPLLPIHLDLSSLNDLDITVYIVPDDFGIVGALIFNTLSPLKHA